MDMSKLFKLQISTIEFFVAISIFLVIVFLIYIFQINKFNEVYNFYEDLLLQQDLENLEVFLDIEGKPKNWNHSHYEILGLKSEEKIDYEKILNVKNISYLKIKENLFVFNEFCIDFEIDRIGNCNFDNSKKVFVRKVIYPIKFENETTILKEIKLIVWK
ncbi:MAG: hypothetical protein QXP34_02155 [Candidatus Aenigmatarchaeota archaeon]